MRIGQVCNLTEADRILLTILMKERRKEGAKNEISKMSYVVINHGTKKIRR